MRKRTDNYRSTHQAIASRVLASPLAAHVFHSIERLQAYANGDEALSAWNYMSLEFRKAGTTCSLSVSLEDKDSFRRVDTDSDGNEWRRHALACQVSWPTHGSTGSATCLARLHFYQQVAMLAADIEAEFGGDNEIYQLVATKADVDARNAKAAAEKAQQHIREVVESNRHNLRVGSERTIHSELIAGIEAGKHEVALGEKRFTLFVTAGTHANLMRVA